MALAEAVAMVAVAVLPKGISVSGTCNCIPISVVFNAATVASTVSHSFAPRRVPLVILPTTIHCYVPHSDLAGSARSAAPGCARR